MQARENVSKIAKQYQRVLQNDIYENDLSELVRFHFADRVYQLEDTGEIGSTKTEMGRTKRIDHVFFTHLASLGKYLSKVVFQLMQPFQLSQPWFPERLLMMCSLLLSLILNGVITSQLASSFSKRMYYEDIDTLEQLEESGNFSRLGSFIVTLFT